MCTFRQYRVTGSKQAVHLHLVVNNREAAQCHSCLKPSRIVHTVNTEQAQMLVAKRMVAFHKVGQQQVAYAQTYTRSLVRISRTNALAGGAYFVLALSAFLRCIQETMSGQNKVSTFGYTQRGKDIYAYLLNGTNLVHKNERVNDYSVADNVLRSLTENA